MSMLIAAILVSIALLLGWDELRSYRKRRDRFAGRLPMSISEWIGELSPDARIDKGIIEDVLQVFASEIGVEPTLLRPTDTLQGNLSLGSIGSYLEDPSWENVTKGLTQVVEKWSGHELSDTDAQRIFDWITLNDVILGVSDIVTSTASVRMEKAMPADD